MMDVTLSVIIVNYNGLKYLKGCFDAIAARLHGIPHEVVVVDNNSADGSCTFIKEQYPQVRLIQSAINLGFGKGNNQAVTHARGRYLLLLNNDTILQHHLQPALQLIQDDHTIGAVGINMLDGNKNYLKPGGRFPSPFTLFRIKNIVMMGREFATGIFSKKTYDIDWLAGSFILLPKALYNEIGGFDDDYFMYGEDIDLCRRIANKGYRRVFMPGLSYIHFVGYNPGRDALIIKGYELYIQKHAVGLQKAFMKAALGFNKIIKKIKRQIK